MLFPIGIIIVFASVVVGYMMNQGDLSLLWQPSEILIIVGAGIGSVLIANPTYIIVKSIKSLSHLFKGKPYDKESYLELLLFSFNVFKLMKIKGMLEIESHIENSDDSDLFINATSINKNNKVKDFIKDHLRLLTMGIDDAYQFEDMIDKELEVYADDVIAPTKLFSTLADALPALGIVAAVLGVMVTMRSITEPPEILGSLIAAALVGTFTGVLLSYGLVGPVASFLIKYSEYEIKYLDCIKAGFIAYLNNNPPIIIAEFMRKNVPEDFRPTFQELDTFISNNSMKIMN
jgi:chemotaxis protein MotA